MQINADRWSSYELSPIRLGAKSPHVPGELLIAPKAGVSDADLESQYNGHGGKKIKTLSQIKVHHIKVSAQALEAIEGALRKNPKNICATGMGHNHWLKFDSYCSDRLRS
jgi:hypothetical protein